MHAPRSSGVVIVHDDERWRERLAQRLCALGIPASAHDSESVAPGLLPTLAPAVLLVGVSMVGRDSIELLNDVRDLESPPAILLVQTGIWQVAELARACAEALGLARVVVLPRPHREGGDEALLGVAVALFASWRYARFAEETAEAVAS